MRRKGKIRLAGALVLAFFFLWTGSALAERATELPVQAAGMVLVDSATTRVLASWHAHEKLPMASTTKIMTAILCIESGDLDRLVTVPDEAFGTEGSSMYLNRGEQISLRDLLYGLMLVSGNDAAVTIAVAVGGSVQGFARMMNEKAQQLGCVNTHFVTPNGLPCEDHYTTAYDLALIAAYAMQNETFRQVVGGGYYRTRTGDQTRTLKSKNRILWEYPGGNGVKTGYTKAAGRCLVFSAQQEEQEVIGVLLNAPDMWNEAESLLNYAFEQYEMKQIVDKGETVANIVVEKGVKESLEIVTKNGILFPQSKESPEKVTMRLNCPRVLEAPVAAGETVGRLEVYCDGRMLADTELLAACPVGRKGYENYLVQLLQGWTGG